MALTPEQTILKASKSVDEAFDRLTKPSETKKIAQTVARQIQKRSRLGYGVDPASRRRQRFPRLSKSYQDQRKGKITFFRKDGVRKPIPIKPKSSPNLDTTTRPTKSNITATGLLLRSIRSAGGKARLAVFIKRVRYAVDIFGNRVKGSKFTTDVVGYLAGMDRVFLALTRGEEKRIQRDLGKRINDLAIRLFNS